MNRASWWQRGVIYQIYPRSFQDSNGDGVGDLEGIRARLDYLCDLGIDAIWISPIFPSPMADFGYDVSDYTDVHPLFGDLDAIDRLIADAHARGLRVLLDLVPNHSSSQHPWFLEARSSRDNPKRDWYIWRDPKPDGSPPNNWLAYFGGAAWTLDEATGQYYLHNFLPEQPDLNYRNPAVKEAIFDAVRFWFRRGIDGFRVDVVDRLIKDPDLRDNPPNPDWKPGDNPTDRHLRVYSEQQEGIHGLIQELRAVFDEFEDRVMVGEIAYSTDPAFITSYYGDSTKHGGSEMQQPFNFAFLMLDWDAAVIRAFVDAYDAAIPPYAWGNHVLGNHDRPRIASRVGVEAARMAMLMLLTLRGTPTIYYGDELGMTDVAIASSDYQDPQGINIGISRDPERTPMLWSDDANAGFCDEGVRPWLPVSRDYAVRNVTAQRDDPTSMLNLTRAILSLRRAEEDQLVMGGYRSFDAPAGCFVYQRGSGFVIALNFIGEPQTIALDAFAEGATIALSTTMTRAGEAVSGALTLAPYEGVIVRIT